MLKSITFYIIIWVSEFAIIEVGLMWNVVMNGIGTQKYMCYLFIFNLGDSRV